MVEQTDKQIVASQIVEREYEGKMQQMVKITFYNPKERKVTQEEFPITK